MDENTTTEPTVPVETGAEALPVEQVEVSAAAEPAPAEPSETPQDGTEAAPAVDADLQKYAESNGIALDSPGAIKAAEIARKAQSEATRNYHKASELEKAASITDADLPADATPQQVDNARYRNVEIQLWKIQNQDKLALEPQMVDILADPTKKAMVQQGYLSLDDIYTMAKGKNPDNSAAAKSEGKREVLQSLAHKQQAAVPTGHATNPGITPKEKPFDQLSLQEMRTRLGTFRQ